MDEIPYFTIHWSDGSTTELAMVVENAAACWSDGSCPKPIRCYLDNLCHRGGQALSDRCHREKSPSDAAPAGSTLATDGAAANHLGHPRVGLSGEVL
jgi:hypothetical protein